MSLPLKRYLPPPYALYKKKFVSDVCENGFVEYFYSRTDPKTGVLEFVVEGNGEHLIVPSKTYLKISLELTGQTPRAAGSPSGKELKDGAKVGVANNIFHSMFESIEVYVSNQATTKTDRNNPYTALLHTLCNFGESAHKTFFQLSGFSKDTGGQMENMESANLGFKARQDWFKDATGNEVEFIGKIFSPLFFQEKVLPTQTSLRVILRTSPPEFYINGEEGNFKLEIKEARLMVQKVDVVRALKDSYVKLLDEGHPIPYFLKTPGVNHMTIDEGSSQFVRDNLFMGRMPRRVVIGMVETESYHGKRTKNPFNFQHFGLSEICLYKDGVPYPRPMIKLDVDGKKCADAYHRFMSSLNAAYTNHVPNITMKDYMEGYTLFSYDLSPDQMGSTHPGSMLNMSSNIRLEMKFKAPTAKNITLLVYYEMENMMEIHKDRQVRVNY